MSKKDGEYHVLEIGAQLTLDTVNSYSLIYTIFYENRVACLQTPDVTQGIVKSLTNDAFINFTYVEQQTYWTI